MSVLGKQWHCIIVCDFYEKKPVHGPVFLCRLQMLSSWTIVLKFEVFLENFFRRVELRLIPVERKHVYNLIRNTLIHFILMKMYYSDTFISYFLTSILIMLQCHINPNFFVDFGRKKNFSTILFCMYLDSQVQTSFTLLSFVF